MQKVCERITLFGKKLFVKGANMDDKFNEKKISHIYTPSLFIVKYYVYSDKKDRTSNFSEEALKKYKLPSKKNTNTSCFAQLPQMLSTFSTTYKKWPNRVLFLCDFKKHSNSECHTTLEERYWWISVCKYHKLLPEYIEKDFAETGNIVLKIDTLDIKTLYIYLIIARHLQEEPYFVKGIKYLVEENGIDFHVAFAVASRCCIGNKAHHVISLGKQYPFSEDHNSINNIKLYNIGHISKLMKFMSGELKNKKTVIKDQKIGVMSNAFNLHSTLYKIKADYNDIKLKDLYKIRSEYRNIKLKDLVSSKIVDEEPISNVG